MQQASNSTAFLIGHMTGRITSNMHFRLYRSEIKKLSYQLGNPNQSTGAFSTQKRNRAIKLIEKKNNNKIQKF